MDEEFEDDVRLPERGTELDPRIYASRLIDGCPEFAHLKEAEVDIAWVESVAGLTDKGRRVLGLVHLPRVQGKLNILFAWLLKTMHGADPDFVIFVDAVWWAQAPVKEREILVYHELCHIAQAQDRDGEPKYDDDTGRPVLTLVGHDIEEFSSVARRYGAWHPELKEFQRALNEGPTT